MFHFIHWFYAFVIFIIWLAIILFNIIILDDLFDKKYFVIKLTISIIRNLLVKYYFRDKCLHFHSIDQKEYSILSKCGHVKMTRLLLKYDILLPYGREEKPYIYNQVDLITSDRATTKDSVLRNWERHRRCLHFIERAATAKAWVLRLIFWFYFTLVVS